MAVLKKFFVNHGSERMLENFENGGGTTVAPQKNKNKLPIGSKVEYKDDREPSLSPSISLTDDHEIINLDGYNVSVKELKEHIIDSFMYRKYIKTLKEAQE